MLPFPYVILDLETTGGTPLHDRIIEIALIRFEEGMESERWETLVNPGISIPPFITHLTGISNGMVKDAPSFGDIAHRLYGFLDGAVLAAHNVRFDYGFLKNEYRRMGALLQHRVLCTARLSRKLYPQHKGHGLDAIMQRHGLKTEMRHRAMGDVELVAAYLEMARRELGAREVQEAAAILLKDPSLPAGLDASILDQIPDRPGVYFFYGKNGLPLYIGKSVTLRSRVMSHFSGDHASFSDMRIAQEVERVEWMETAGELGALLLESRLIKEHHPIHNKRLRRSRTLFSLKLGDDSYEAPLVNIVTEEDIHPEVFGDLYGLFRSKTKAVDALREVVRENRLCPRVVGLENGKGACFAHQLKRCNGVCAGKEVPQLHYLRLKQALLPLKLKSWPYPGRIGIREYNASSGRSEVHVFHYWCHLGTVDNEAGLDDVLGTRSSMKFDLDTYKLLLKTLGKQTEVITFG
ncbi:exonuclease domain-containing protein [Nitrosospira multiformis]|uniref:DNA-directed DNA polymerase n=1 Tax=Nitrosospira multiformis (strain ATCC 25196 / NCIMB 11849 / C 71) TaxID=323848 RepID=Q2Y7H4_NITMU|nr:exonuclease domain-containing protein [Nitrosospira multiformis]ABB75297.1 DNA polymerase III, epsilon subunit [Nitrosospira multiformis ATCC 25196]SDZ93370.1 DNA polymerase-3 subunit epsilon [Nitrosospira multiformis]SEF58442.1 DNA polymerase-3 subunit epsilon [Nitrosospira multiformis ATCC 25196]